MNSLDSTVSRVVQFSEAGSLEFRAEAFNVFNHAQFFGVSTVQGNISSANFGQAVSAMSPGWYSLRYASGFEVMRW